MKHAYKSTLYSVFIFPGSGHLQLKRYRMAFLYGGIACICLVALVAHAFSVAQGISERILLGEIPYDIPRITQEVRQQMTTTDSSVTSVATWLLVGCWIVAGIDAFRVGRLQDRVEQADAQS